MGCAIISGIAITCDDLKRVGGVNKRVYLFNIEELDDTKYTFTTDFVSEINFQATFGLYAFNSKKKSHSAGYSIQKNQPGGNTYFQHDAIVKVFPDSPTEDGVIEDLVVSNVGLIVEDNNQQFFIYGAENGLEVTEGTQNTGQENASDIALPLTFTGEEKTLPLRISVDGSGTDYAATKAYLETLIV